MLNKQKKEKKFFSAELSFFCDQVAMLLHGGVSINEGIYILYTEMEDGSIKETLYKIDELMKTGTPFYLALQKTKAFPDYMIQLTRIGETVGKLEDVMYSLSEYYDREHKLKSSIRSAIQYPFVLFMMMSAILGILVFRILPIFQSIYEELSSDISSSSDNLMTFGIHLGTATAVIIVVLALIGLSVLIWYRTPKGNSSIKRICYNFKLTRKISDMMSTGKFISALALMISAGLETKTALELASGSGANHNFDKKVKECIHLFESGMSLEKAICKANLLRGIEAGMVLVAAKSGTTDIVFKKLGDMYNDKTNDTLGKLSNYIETILIISLAILLGIILLSVMLPLINIISGMG